MLSPCELPKTDLPYLTHLPSSGWLWGRTAWPPNKHPKPLLSLPWGHLSIQKTWTTGKSNYIKANHPLLSSPSTPSLAAALSQEGLVPNGCHPRAHHVPCMTRPTSALQGLYRPKAHPVALRKSSLLLSCAKCSWDNRLQTAFSVPPGFIYSFKHTTQ